MEQESRSICQVPKGTRDIDAQQLQRRDEALKLIKGVFIRHGALGMDTPVFERRDVLQHQYGHEQKLVYDLADQGGELLSLRYDLTVPLARYVASRNLKKFKRYQMGKVYRRDNPSMNQGRFREFYQCDFDICGQEESMLTDAEVLKVLCEVLDGFQLNGQYQVRLSSRKLLDAIMQVCGIPADKFRAICSAIDKLDKQPWPQVYDEMIHDKGLSEQIANRLAQYLLPTSETKSNEDMLQYWKQDKMLASHPKAIEALAEIELLLSYARSMGVDSNKLLLDPSLARGLDYYTGLIFEAVLYQTEPRKTSSSIAAGGRYDHLIGSLGRHPVPAVGVSIGLDRLLALFKEDKEGKESKQRHKEQNVHVLVCSIGKGMIHHRLQLCAEIWQAGMGAQFLYHANPKPKKQLAKALEDKIQYMIWIGESEIESGHVKLKNLETHLEEMIPRTQIISTLRLLQSQSEMHRFEQRALESEKAIVVLRTRVQALEERLGLK